MENQGLSVLSEEDRVFLYQQRGSEHFKVYQKALNNMYLSECAKLVSLTPDQLVMQQGILKGLAMAKNLILLGKIDQ